MFLTWISVLVVQVQAESKVDFNRSTQRKIRILRPVPEHKLNLRFWIRILDYCFASHSSTPLSFVTCRLRDVCNLPSILYSMTIMPPKEEKLDHTYYEELQAQLKEALNAKKVADKALSGVEDQIEKFESISSTSSTQLMT